MRRAIIGWSGFVGQTLLQAYPDADIYNSSNISTLKYKIYDELFMCGMPAEKWKINKEPENDKHILQTFIDIFDTISVGRFVLLSTVDVLDCTVEQDETGVVYAVHPYGIHRRMLEEYVASKFDNVHILRLPGLFGKGLKKNIIYDLLNNNQLTNICLDSEFQWYWLGNIQIDIDYCIRHDIQIVHLVSPPITVRQIVSSFFPEKVELCKGLSAVKYCLKTNKVMGYWRSTDETMNELQQYLQVEFTLRKLPFTLSVSNIAWTDSQFSEVRKLLTHNGIRAVEVAPSKITSWGSWNPDILKSLVERGIDYSSCQSILYNIPIEIFKEPDTFKKHYEEVCLICQGLGIHRIVFGSPKARHRYDSSDEFAVELFREIGSIGTKYDVACCIEPNSSQYGCTWLTRLDDVYRFVKLVGHPYVKINFDFGNYVMEDDTSVLTPDIINNIGHVQVSGRFLKPLCEIDVDDITKYKDFAKQIKNGGYANYVSLEMVECSIQKLSLSISLFISLFY